MNYSDLINGVFEIVGAITTFLSVLKLHKDKIVKGVHWLPVAYFFSWGVFNTWFYPHNGLYFSFFGGILLMIVNFMWVGQMIYYIKKNKVHLT